MESNLTANNTTRKLLVAFMDFFTGMTVEKYTYDGSDSIYTNRKFIEVPVQYAPGDKWIQMVNSGFKRTMDPKDQNRLELEWVLPRISVNLTGITYDSIRHQNKMNRVRGDRDGQAVYNKFMPVPYNLDIDVTLISRTLDVQFQIIEQIIPHFAASKSFDVKTNPLFDAESVPFILQSVSPNFQEEYTEDEIRLYDTTLTFMVKANYYKPSPADVGHRITTVITDFHIDPTAATFEKYVQAAKLTDPVGEYSDRADVSLNPVDLTITEENEV